MSDEALQRARMSDDDLRDMKREGPGPRHGVTSVYDALMKVIDEALARSARADSAEVLVGRLREGLDKFVQAITRVEESPEYRGLYELAYDHGFKYTGPTYTVEIEAARELLKATPARACLLELAEHWIEEQQR